MAAHQFAILDPAAGISGDMLLGALVEAGAGVDWVVGLPARLGVPDVTVEVHRVSRCSLAATKVTVRAPDGSAEGPGHGHGHGGAHHGPHRHVAALIRLIEKAPFSEPTRARAIAAFRALAEAEGRVHGLAPEKVALHEVGAYDALVDIVGGVEGFERLGVEAVYSLPVATGTGWVTAAHGTLPVPAPATAYLLEGMEVASGGLVTGEATTPTGAALLRVLSQGAPPARWRPTATAWGAGGRDPAGWPNALRLVLAEAAAEAGQVAVLATDVDDLSPEYLEPLREALSMAGAVDVQVWPVQMKKGRIGFRIEAVAPRERQDAVADAMLRHSTTAGLRVTIAERVTLPRRESRIETATGGAVRIKTVEAPGGPRAKPEYDDVVAEARRSGRPALEVAREFLELAGRRARASAGSPDGRVTAPKESE